MLEKSVKRRIEHFKDLDAWKRSHELVLQIYNLYKSFPDNEKYGLTSQIRRAAISITSNIAEGMGRYSYKDRIRFLYNSRGSLFEVENLLLLAFDLEYLKEDEYEQAIDKLIKARMVMNGFINSTEKFLSENNRSSEL